MVIVEAETKLSYGQWNRQVNAVAKSLVEKFGIRKGDHAGIIAYNGTEQLTATMTPAYLYPMTG